MKPKSGIVVMIVLAKTLATWLREITKLIDCSDRKVMQLRVFYAHGQRYKNVNAEPITDKNKHLLICDAQDNVKFDQERGPQPVGGFFG